MENKRCHALPVCKILEKGGNIMNKTLIITFITGFLILTASLYADDGVSKRIEGVADFLIERANENLICMFEEKINKNPLIKEYFPNTTKMLTTVNLKVLMLNERLWKYNVEKDINTLTEMLKDNLKKEGISILTNDSYQEFIEFKDELENMVKDVAFIDKYNEFVRLTNENMKAINIDKLTDPEHLEIAQMLVNDLIEKTIELNTLTEKIKKDIKNKKRLLENMESIVHDLKSINIALESVDYIINKSSSYTEQISNIFIIVENLEGLRREFIDKNKTYKKFKHYSLFFAQLSDANSQESAKVVLRTFALPSKSYISKRRGELKISISSYLGFATGIETANMDNYGYYGLTAPIGIEWTIITGKKGSLGAFGSFFDLGGVVNSRLHNETDTYKIKDSIRFKRLSPHKLL